MNLTLAAARCGAIKGSSAIGPGQACILVLIDGLKQFFVDRRGSRQFVHPCSSRCKWMQPLDSDNPGQRANSSIAPKHLQHSSCSMPIQVHLWLLLRFGALAVKSGIASHGAATPLRYWSLVIAVGGEFRQQARLFRRPQISLPAVVATIKPASNPEFRTNPVSLQS
jgi:hypothetical protein